MILIIILHWQALWLNDDDGDGDDYDDNNNNTNRLTHTESNADKTGTLFMNLIFFMKKHLIRYHISWL